MVEILVYNPHSQIIYQKGFLYILLKLVFKTLRTKITHPEGIGFSHKARSTSQSVVNMSVN